MRFFETDLTISRIDAFMKELHELELKHGVELVGDENGEHKVRLKGEV